MFYCCILLDDGFRFMVKVNKRWIVFHQKRDGFKHLTDWEYYADFVFHDKNI